MFENGVMHFIWLYSSSAWLVQVPPGYHKFSQSKLAGFSPIIINSILSHLYLSHVMYDTNM